jgi:hypothetical protein
MIMVVVATVTTIISHIFIIGVKENNYSSLGTPILKLNCILFWGYELSLLYLNMALRTQDVSDLEVWGFMSPT